MFGHDHHELLAWVVWPERIILTVASLLVGFALCIAAKRSASPRSAPGIIFGSLLVATLVVIPPVWRDLLFVLLCTLVALASAGFFGAVLALVGTVLIISLLPVGTTSLLVAVLILGFSLHTAVSQFRWRRRLRQLSSAEPVDRPVLVGGTVLDGTSVPLPGNDNLKVAAFAIIGADAHVYSTKPIMLEGPSGRVQVDPTMVTFDTFHSLPLSDDASWRRDFGLDLGQTHLLQWILPGEECCIRGVPEVIADPNGSQGYRESRTMLSFSVPTDELALTREGHAVVVRTEDWSSTKILELVNSPLETLQAESVISAVSSGVWGSLLLVLAIIEQLP